MFGEEENSRYSIIYRSPHTIEAIGKYELISCTPFNQWQMLLITHVNRLIFRAESNGSTHRIPRSHLEGAGGQVDQGQEGVHHVKI